MHRRARQTGLVKVSGHKVRSACPWRAVSGWWSIVMQVSGAVPIWAVDKCKQRVPVNCRMSSCDINEEPCYDCGDEVSHCRIGFCLSPLAGRGHWGKETSYSFLSFENPPSLLAPKCVLHRISQGIPPYLTAVCTHSSFNRPCTARGLSVWEKVRKKLEYCKISIFPRVCYG